jgi:hypothetical protein
MLSVCSVSCQQLTSYNCFHLESNYPESKEIYNGSCFPVHAQYVPLLNNDPYGSVQSICDPAIFGLSRRKTLFDTKPVHMITGGEKLALREGSFHVSQVSLFRYFSTHGPHTHTHTHTQNPFTYTRRCRNLKKYKIFK